VKKPIQFGKYYLLDRINVGGMAEVFKAKAFGVEGFERLLAVKRILPNIAEDEEFITMFIDEAKIAVQLNHANICQIFDLGKVEDSYFIALEYVHGKDLRAIFDRCKQKPVDGATSMPIAQACFVTMKCCEGLDYAHNKKDQSAKELHLVHRDVSPQNILISYEGEVKLIDFGIAKAAGKASKTQQGILKGKFGYMSPEQVRGLPLDRRSDIFSLGIVLYELLTGERLFIGESDFSTLEKVRNVEILPPSTYNRRIPEELERICMKALAKDVEDRYQNAIDLHDDLQAFMYTAGEFYSRKDLAGWMKKVFVSEIESENAKLESYNKMPAPPSTSPSTPISTAPAGGAPAGERPRRNSIPPPPPPGAVGGARISQPHPIVPTPPPAAAAAAAPVAPSVKPPGKPANGHQPPRVGAEAELGWDDEELATNIYDAPEDAADAIVDDRPDLSNIELSADGAPVPASGKNGAGPSKAQPFDFVMPGPAAEASAVRIDAPAGMRPRPASRMGLYAGLALGGAVVCAAAVWLFVFMGNKPGEVVITSEPSVNVQVLVDNKRVAVDGTPATLKLEPGSYVLTVQREGYVPWNEQVEVRSGERLSKRIVLEPLAAGTGFTLVSEPPGLQASLDGHTLEGLTPLKVQSVTPGKHHIEVRSASGATWSQDVELSANKILDVHAVVGAVAAKEPPAAAKEPPAPKPVAREPAVAKEPPAPKPVAAKETAPAPVKEPAPPREKPAKVAAAPAPLPRLPKETADKDTAPAPAPKKQPEKVAAKSAAKPALVDDDADDKPEPKPAAAPPKPVVKAGDGYLRLNSKPWTNIAVDGKESGLHTPQTQMKLPSGSHRITLTNPQFNIKETFSVDVKAGETVTVIKDLRKQDADSD
jgi:serine/threonine protein kinase